MSTINTVSQSVSQKSSTIIWYPWLASPLLFREQIANTLIIHRTLGLTWRFHVKISLSSIILSKLLLWELLLLVSCLLSVRSFLRIEAISPIFQPPITTFTRYIKSNFPSWMIARLTNDTIPGLILWKKIVFTRSPDENFSWHNLYYRPSYDVLDLSIESVVVLGLSLPITY